jgi:hypothetical protein
MTTKEIIVNLEPPGGKFDIVDRNFIHVIIDKTDSGSYYHGTSIAEKVRDDFRMDSFKFEVILYDKKDVFIDSFNKCSKENLKNFEGEDVIQREFLAKLGTGDIVVATGGEKILRGLWEAALQNDETFFYFGSTKKIKNFQRDKFDFDLFTLPNVIIKEEEKDDDDIIAISEFAVFHKKPDIQTYETSEKDYKFFVLPYLTSRRKQELRVFRKIKSTSFGFENALEALKNSALTGKIVIISNLKDGEENEDDVDTKLAIKKEIKRFLGNGEIKVKFISQDYVKSNKIPTVINKHLLTNTQSQLILPTCNLSEIFFVKSHNVDNNKILCYNSSLKEEINILEIPKYSFLNARIMNILNSLAEFSAIEIEALKIYKSETITQTVISTYIAETIIWMYIEETQSRDTKTEVIEEDIILEEEIEEIEIEEIEELSEEEIEEIEGENIEENLLEGDLEPSEIEENIEEFSYEFEPESMEEIDIEHHSVDEDFLLNQDSLDEHQIEIESITEEEFDAPELSSEGTEVKIIETTTKSILSTTSQSGIEM